jgi:RNA polymerase sigma-70 factor (ECF subfamily)
MMRSRVVRPEPVARAPILEEVEDADLVRRATSGDRWAEEAIFRKHAEFVGALGRRLLGDPVEADDIVQETFLDAFAGLRGLAHPNRLRGWLAGIATHKIHRRFRRRRLLAIFGLDRSSHDAMLAASAHESAPAEVRAELARLDAVLRDVPDVDRAAWLLRYVEGFGVSEVAELCTCSLNTAKRRIARTQEVVRRHVDIDEADSG